MLDGPPRLRRAQRGQFRRPGHVIRPDIPATSGPGFAAVVGFGVDHSGADRWPQYRAGQQTDTDRIAGKAPHIEVLDAAPRVGIGCAGWGILETVPKFPTPGLCGFVVNAKGLPKLSVAVELARQPTAPIDRFDLGADHLLGEQCGPDQKSKVRRQCAS